MEGTPSLIVLSGWRDLQWSASEIPAMRLLDVIGEVNKVFLIFGDSSSSVLVLQLAFDGAEVGPPLRLPISGKPEIPLRWNPPDIFDCRPPPFNRQCESVVPGF